MRNFVYLVVNSLVVYHFFFFLMGKDVLILYFLKNFTISQLQLGTQYKPSVNIFSQVFKLRYWRKQYQLKNLHDLDLDVSSISML